MSQQLPSKPDAIGWQSADYQRAAQARWKATTNECFQDASQTSDQATLTLEIELAMRLSQLLSSKGLEVPEGLEGYHGSTKMLWGENGQVIAVMDDGP